MELPQPRPFETEGRKPTHDFLSLYSHPNVQQDARAPSQGGYPKTHDFLQPLERVGKASAKEVSSSVDISAFEKPPPPAAPPPPVAQHVLPGGIGTYTISHSSYFNQRVPKPEVSSMFTVVQANSNVRNTDENSNCSSSTGGGFTLWEESAGKKGQTRKENTGERLNVREAAAKMGQWTTSKRPSQSSTISHRNSLSCLSSSLVSEKKGQSFMEMIRSAKGSSQDDDLDDDEEFGIKKESPSPTQKGELRVNFGGKNAAADDQRPNTPRSKHSATEQRRRSKINDRFQMLRQLIPNSDQKRDKASFLLEVIEYIQFLQERVNKYEGSYQGWNHEPGKPMNWRNNQRSAEGYIDQPRGIDGCSAPAAVYAPKFEEKNSPISQTILTNSQNRLDQLDKNSAQTMRLLDQQHGTFNKAMPYHMSHQPNFFTVLTGTKGSQVSTRQETEADNNTTSKNQARPCPNQPHSNDYRAAADRLKEQDLAVEGGSISISSVYSQGLLKNLTQALLSSGVDLSQASISVQIELAKHGEEKISSITPPIKENEVAPNNQRTTRPRVETRDDFDQNPKKMKMDGN